MTSSSATAAIDRRSRPFGPGFTYVNGIHASRAPRRDVQYLRLYNSGDYDHIPASIRPYYILSLMKDGHSRSSLKRNRTDSDEEGPPSAASDKFIEEEVEEVEEAPVRKRRRTSSMLSEVSALEEPEEVADTDQECWIKSLGGIEAFNSDVDDTAFESPRSHIDRPSFLGDIDNIVDSRPQLEPVEEEETEGEEEEEEHSSRSSAASPSVVSVGSGTSELSTPVRSSESEGSHTEGSVGIGEAVEALDEHFEEASTRSTDEEESIEEVIETSSEEDEEEPHHHEGEFDEIESTEEALEPSSDEEGNGFPEDEEMEDIEMEDVELRSHDSGSEAEEVESKASDGSGEDITPHEEEHTPEVVVESPSSQIESDEEVDGTKTPTADSLLDYHPVEESDAIGSPSESVQFSPDEDAEQPESPLSSEPIDAVESLSGNLEEESDTEHRSHVDTHGAELAEEQHLIDVTPVDEDSQQGDGQSEHEAVRSHEVEDAIPADGDELEDIPKSAAGRPLRRAAIAALGMIHSEISAFTRPYHYHTHDVPPHAEGSKEQSLKEESSPVKTSPRKRSPKKEKPAEELVQDAVSVLSDDVLSAASSTESPKKTIIAASPLAAVGARKRSPPKDSQRSYAPSEGSSDTSSVVDDLPSTPSSTLEPIPMTPAPKRANKRGGRLTQLSRSPTVRRTTRASALEAKHRIHELAGGRTITAHNAEESREEHLSSGSALLDAIKEDRARGMHEKSRSPQGTGSMKSRDLHVPPSIDPPVFHPVDNEANDSVLEDAEAEDSQPVRQSARLQAKANNDSSAASSSNASPEKPRRGRSSASRSAPSEATTPTKSRKRPASAAAKSKTKARKDQLAAIPEEDSVEEDEDEDEQTKRPRRAGGRRAAAR